MSQPLRSIDFAPVWRGRSWKGLVDRRCDAFAHAQSMKGVTARNSDSVVASFLAFFAADGGELFSHEEEWLFDSLGKHDVPHAVLRAYDDHVQISSLTDALSREKAAGCADLRVVRRLGELLEQHLLLEKKEIRPLVRRLPGSPWAHVRLSIRRLHRQTLSHGKEICHANDFSADDGTDASFSPGASDRPRRTHPITGRAAGR